MNETALPADHHVRNQTTPKWLRWVPPRMFAFLFKREPERIFHSPATTEELKVRLKAGLEASLLTSLTSKHGACGFLFGTEFHVYWATGAFNDSFAPVFHGRLESTADGSVIRGRMSHSRFTRVFLHLWCGGLLLISLVSFWTIIMPFAAYGMLWLLNGMMAIGDHLHPGRRERILDFILQVCDSEKLSQ